MSRPTTKSSLSFYFWMVIRLWKNFIFNVPSQYINCLANRRLKKTKTEQYSKHATEIELISNARQNTGLRAKINTVTPDATWNHCILYKKALTSNKLSLQINQYIVKSINYVNTSLLKSRTFNILYEDVGF